MRKLDSWDIRTWQRMYAEYHGHVRVVTNNLMWLSDWEPEGYACPTHKVWSFWWIDGSGQDDANRNHVFEFDEWVERKDEWEAINILHLERLSGPSEEPPRDATPEEIEMLFTLVDTGRCWEPPSDEFRKLREMRAPDE